MKQVDTFSLVCVYNITYIHLTSLKLMALYASTKSLEAHTASSDLHKTYRDQIEHSLDSINNKLAFIAPRVRVRRGLINGLGSVVKAITGNLDNDDALKYERLISQLQHQVNSIYKTEKSSISLAEKTIQEFSKQLVKINENQLKLSNIISNTTSGTNLGLRQAHFLDIYVQIDFSLQIIIDKLMLLEDAITFSQLGVMHPSIINPGNLMFEIINLKRKFSINPVSDINVVNIQKIERSIDVKAYSTDHSLTFILDIPSVSPNTYDLIHLYSIPSKLNLTIVPKSKYLILGHNEYAYLDEECRRISGDSLLCKQLDTRPVEDTEDCVVSLIQHRSANCTHAKMKLKNGKLQKLSLNQWLVVTTNNEVMKFTCDMKTEYRSLQGVNIISLPQECQADLMNRTLQSHSTTVTINEVIPVPDQSITKPANIHYQLHLEDVSLDSIHELINKAENIQNDDDDAIITWPLVMATPSWTTIILYIIGAALLSWKLYRCHGARKLHCSETPKSEGPPGSCGTRFFLKEGGVTMSRRHANADNAAV